MRRFVVVPGDEFFPELRDVMGNDIDWTWTYARNDTINVFPMCFFLEDTF